jgi:ribosomal protein S18 acetylase RimI-like enzyme
VGLNEEYAERIRPATADDADAILALHLLRDLANLGEPSTTVDEVEADLGVTTVQAAVLSDQDGQLLGHGWLDHQDGWSKTWGDITVRPGADPIVAVVMLDWVLATAREIDPGLPVHLFADSHDFEKIAAYQARNGQVVRRFCRMRIELEHPLPAASLAPGVAIRGVESTEDDLRTAYRIADTSFADHFGHESDSYEAWREITVDGALSDLSLWWIATVDGEPASVLYAGAAPGGGHIDTLGTLREFRGRGLGRALMLTAFTEFLRRDRPRVTLGVDATSPTGARELYESLGMTVSAEGLRYELHP